VLLPIAKRPMKKRFLYPLRILLCVLIVLNLLLIYQLSDQSGPKSDGTSWRVTCQLAQIFVPDFVEKPLEEQHAIVSEMHAPVRNLAHMSEFGLLGLLIFALLLTWHGQLAPRYFGSIGAVLLCAILDEAHQHMTAGRATQLQDVGLDLLGALLSCSFLLLIVHTVRKRKGILNMKFQITRYRLKAKLPTLRLAIASDLHGTEHGEILKLLEKEAPDMILIPGDLTDDEGLREENGRAYDFLERAARIAPTYYSLGNHELACYHKGNPWRHPIPIPLTEEIKERIAKTGATLLDNNCVTVGELTVCGLTSGINGKINAPNQEVLERFAKQAGYRILLCHHPEYFMPHVRATDIELTVCGHAHGGQWRFFGKGTYAPGQGIFPKYTAGVLENRCVISRGLGNHTWIPRIFNKHELVIVELGQ